jgi:PDZ domain-containing protein
LASAVFVVFVGFPSVFLAWAAIATTPYYAIAPGDATPTEPLITATGATLYPAKGQVLYTTVRTHLLSKLEKFRFDHGWWDSNTDVVPAAAIEGTKSASETRKEDLRVMGFSKDTATYVALRRLGYSPKVIGGGVIVTDIVPNVAAAKVLKKGDLITSLDGTPTPVDVDLRAIIARHQPGDVVAAQVADRDGKNARTVQVPLSKREDGATYIGIATGVPDTIRFQFPVKLNIDTGGVGGPSAGLAFTLSALDALTPGELTGGKRVAVTGTIDFSGEVGEIGGIKQKAIAVQRAKADVFIVPASEAKDAVAAVKGSKLQIIGVDTLDDALAELAKLGGNALTLGTPGAGH